MSWRRVEGDGLLSGRRVVLWRLLSRIRLNGRLLVGIGLLLRRLSLLRGIGLLRIRLLRWLLSLLRGIRLLRIRLDGRLFGSRLLRRGLLPGRRLLDRRIRRRRLGAFNGYRSRDG